MTNVVPPCASIRTNPFGSNAAAAARAGATRKPTTSATAEAALAWRNSRRDGLGGESSGIVFTLLLASRRELDRFADAQIRPAAANVARHRRVDVGVARLRLAREQCSSRHDLPGLAVAALHDLEVEPGALNLAPRRRFADRL